MKVVTGTATTTASGFFTTMPMSSASGVMAHPDKKSDRAGRTDKLLLSVIQKYNHAVKNENNNQNTAQRNQAKPL